MEALTRQSFADQLAALDQDDAVSYVPAIESVYERADRD